MLQITVGKNTDGSWTIEGPGLREIVKRINTALVIISEEMQKIDMEVPSCASSVNNSTPE